MTQLTKWQDVSPPNLAKHRSHEIGCYNNRFALRFDRHIGSDAAEMPVKFQIDWMGINPSIYIYIYIWLHVDSFQCFQRFPQPFWYWFWQIGAYWQGKIRFEAHFNRCAIWYKDRRDFQTNFLKWYPCWFTLQRGEFMMKKIVRAPVWNMIMQNLHPSQWHHVLETIYALLTLSQAVHRIVMMFSVSYNVFGVTLA